MLTHLFNKLKQSNTELLVTHCQQQQHDACIDRGNNVKISVQSPQPARHKGMEVGRVMVSAEQLQKVEQGEPQLRKKLMR